MKHTAGYQMQRKFLAVYDDGVARVVPAAAATYEIVIRAYHIYDLALAFIAPLGADDYVNFTHFSSFCIIFSIKASTSSAKPLDFSPSIS